MAQAKNAVVSLADLVAASATQAPVASEAPQSARIGYAEKQLLAANATPLTVLAVEHQTHEGSKTLPTPRYELRVRVGGSPDARILHMNAGKKYSERNLQLLQAATGAGSQVTCRLRKVGTTQPTDKRPEGFDYFTLDA